MTTLTVKDLIDAMEDAREHCGAERQTDPKRWRARLAKAAQMRQLFAYEELIAAGLDEHVLSAVDRFIDGVEGFNSYDYRWAARQLQAVAHIEAVPGRVAGLRGSRGSTGEDWFAERG